MSEDGIFEPSFGNRPSRLVGRGEILRHFDQAIASRPGSRERAVLLLGQRGSGKTVLLWELADRARRAGFVVANPTVSGNDMLGRIVEKIQDDGERFVKSHKTHVAGGSLSALGFSVGLQFSRETDETKSFPYKLARLCRALSTIGRGVLILIDETQANSDEMRQLISAYQEIVGEGLDISIAMAGLPGAVSATLNDKVLTFLNRARKLHLGSLPCAEVEAYYSYAFASLGLSAPADLLERAARAGAASPYLMQLIGHYVALFASDEGIVDDASLGTALEHAQRDFEEDVCRTSLMSLSERDVDFLRAMAEDEGESSMSDIAHRMEVTDDYARRYRKRLVDAGVIEVSRRAHVTFSIPYLADYLRRTE